VTGGAPLTVQANPVGSHVPVARGLATGGLAYAARIGAEAIQVFASNPRGWALAAGDADQDAKFRAGCERAQIVSFVHTPYLVNFGSPTPATRERSIEAVRHNLRRAAAIGARGVVVHTGSAVDAAHREAGMRQVRESLLPLLDEIPAGGPDVLLEPTAGAGQSLCARVEELEPYLQALDDHPRVGVCLDTCHAFAAGHDLAGAGGAAATLDALVRAVGQHRLRLVHANDSKDPLGSCRDRHERLGRGQIGLNAFAELLAHPAMRGVPLVIETPGGELAHAQDVALLRDLRSGERRPGAPDEQPMAAAGLPTGGR
jgi:deoxyribonuclease-4